MSVRMAGYWRRMRPRRRRPPDERFFDTNQSHGSSSNSSRSSGGRHHRNVRTVFLCGCRIDVSFTPRGRRSGGRRTSLRAEANSASLAARAASILELEPRGTGDLMKTDDEAVQRGRMSRGTRRRLALCGFDVYAAPSVPAPKRRRGSSTNSDSDQERDRECEEPSSPKSGGSFEFESSLSSSRVGEFVYSSIAMHSAPILEPQPQFETPPPDDASDIDDLSEHEWPTDPPVGVTDLTLRPFPGTRPRSRISVGCNGWITAESPPQALARLSEIAESVLSPEQSQFSVGIADDTGDTISRYALDSFRGPTPMNVNFDLISVAPSSSQSGEPERKSEESSASISTGRQRRRISPTGSFSLDDLVSHRSDVPYRITEDAALPRFCPDDGDKKSESPPTSTRSSKASKRHQSLLPFLMKRRVRSPPQPEQKQERRPPQPQASAATVPMAQGERPSIIYIDFHT